MPTPYIRLKWAVYILKQVGQKINSEKRGFVESHAGVTNGMLFKRKNKISLSLPDTVKCLRSLNGRSGIFISWDYKDVLGTTSSTSLWDQYFNDFIRKYMNDVLWSHLALGLCHRLWKISTRQRRRMGWLSSVGVFV